MTDTRPYYRGDRPCPARQAAAHCVLHADHDGDHRDIKGDRFRLAHPRPRADQ